MIWPIFLFISIISFGDSAIFYMKDNDKIDEPFSFEFFKLLGLKVDTNADTLKDKLSGMLSSQVEGIGKNEQSAQVPLQFTLAVDKAKTELQSNAPNCIDFRESCKSLVGTSVIPVCRLGQVYAGDEKKHLPRSCKEILDNGNNKSGIYEIHPRTSSRPFSVLCDMETKGGGWTHIQKRFDGSQDFYLPWRDYKFGFGDLNGEFWIGLENIYHMTGTLNALGWNIPTRDLYGFEDNELLIELTDREQIKAYAQYSLFAIGSEKQGYILKNLTGFSGDAGDALTHHLGFKFSTSDLDQDLYTGNCAVLYEGAWWYETCYQSNLNGKFMNKPLPGAYQFHGLNWNGFRGYDYNLAGSRMLIRPVGVAPV